ncbi:MAG TPA: FAD:protein FMN transferase [Thermomicrobiales bacterium]|nr:FAD:protein FMN transferase [Thermomicrobiales bacterium]
MIAPGPGEPTVVAAPRAAPPREPAAMGYRRTAVLMDTLVTIEVVDGAAPDAAAAVERAFGWFCEVEARCNRFDPLSELTQLSARIDVPTPVSPLLYAVLDFALGVARASDGAFDPTLGYDLARRGFDRDYRTGRRGTAAGAPVGRADYRDVRLDPARQAVTLRRPLLLDLGAVAKGLAIDLAARELLPCRDFAIDAGGDLYLGGRNAAGEPWRVGVRHPRRADAALAVLRVGDLAVCTSGDYERRSPGPGGGHHLLDPRTGRPAAGAASVTVVAPTAMLADALATAAFVLGPERGLRLLERQGVAGLIVTPELDYLATPGFAEYQQWPS